MQALLIHQTAAQLRVEARLTLPIGHAMNHPLAISVDGRVRVELPPLWGGLADARLLVHRRLGLLGPPRAALDEGEPASRQSARAAIVHARHRAPDPSLHGCIEHVACMDGRTGRICGFSRICMNLDEFIEFKRI